jgi:hypothetical protein
VGKKRHRRKEDSGDTATAGAGGAECSNGGDVRDSSRPLAAATLWVDMAYVDHTTFLCSAHLNVTSIFKCCIISSVKGIYIFHSNLHY